MSIAAFTRIDPKNYSTHALHQGERAWPETNCYIDVWIEVIHALGLDPVAMLPVVLSIDFDGDQWTFFKPSHEDLFLLYGIDVQELNVWKSLLENTEEQLKRGRIVLTEADAYYLPDTQGTDYRTKHTKTTIGIQSIDLAQKRFDYFHNAGYYSLQGEDFEKLMRLENLHDPMHMPFFAEFIRLDQKIHRDPNELAKISKDLIRKYLKRLPIKNPIKEFQKTFDADIEVLKAAGMDMYHAYAFANLRQLGSAFELAGILMKWLEKDDTSGQWLSIETHFTAISQLSKTILLKMARAVANKRPVDFAPLLAEMETHWDQGMDQLTQRFK
ncbi:MAG: DUF1839 family protein [Proteobacteria bacterium]|nr:DUF1839 family protein [Pseudomonadota bacterium]